MGIITATDLLRAFAELLGGTQEGVSRIDVSDADMSGWSSFPIEYKTFPANRSNAIVCDRSQSCAAESVFGKIWRDSKVSIRRPPVG